jgi:hypothetical protein
VRDLLGHSSIKMTSRYVQTAPEGAEKAVRNLRVTQLPQRKRKVGAKRVLKKLPKASKRAIETVVPEQARAEVKLAHRAGPVGQRDRLEHVGSLYHQAVRCQTSRIDCADLDLRRRASRSAIIA